jgi:hypothetical protein
MALPIQRRRRPLPNAELVNPVRLCGAGEGRMKLASSIKRAAPSLILVAALVALAVRSTSAQDREATGVEEIYVVRSVRESRVAPTEFCSKAKSGVSDAIVEDQYALRSVATRTSDGRILDANVNSIGSIRACFGRTPNPAISEFYGDIRLGSTAMKGFGECQLAKSDFPEQGVSVFRCFLELSNLPTDYIGGQLTTNTVNSRKLLGAESDPPGFTQPSIATIRLWRKRTGG